MENDDKMGEQQLMQPGAAPPYQPPVGPDGPGGYPPAGSIQVGYPAPPPGAYPPPGQPGYPPQQQQGYPPQQQQGYPPPQQQPQQTTTQIVITGNCPTCHAGVVSDSYTACGIILAICFFPLGIICCLMMKERRCSNCNTTFG